MTPYTKSAKQKVFAEEAGCPQSAVSKHIMLAAVGALKNTTDRNIHNMGDVVFSAAGPEETSAKHLFPFGKRGKGAWLLLSGLKSSFWIKVNSCVRFFVQFPQPVGICDAVLAIKTTQHPHSKSINIWFNDRGVSGTDGPQN